jgi:hypothetical protein|tara:strand:+ start:181 stop:624 length:444 start_codon:yes stop_codon:yes gene_type:complete
MLNNLTILSVVVALFVYFGGKNVPKELSKYKLLIVGFTCGLIICSFVKRNVEGFRIPGDSQEDDWTTISECITRGESYTGRDREYRKIFANRRGPCTDAARQSRQGMQTKEEANSAARSALHQSKMAKVLPHSNFGFGGFSSQVLDY